MNWRSSILCGILADFLGLLDAMIERAGPPLQDYWKHSTLSRSESGHSAIAAHLTALIESTQDPIWSVDLDYRIVTFNRAFADQIRRDWAAAIEPGMTASHILPPERADLWPELYDRALREGPYRTEYALRDGRWLELSFNPVEVNGAAAGISVFGKDITERKLAEESRRASEARFRGYFNLPLVGVAMTSLHKGIIAVNDKMCDILGYSREELTADTWVELTHPDDLQSDLDQFARLVAGEIDTYSLEKRFIRKDGRTIWTAISVGCVRKPDGTVDYICANVRDISERKRTQEALHATEARFRALFEKAPTAIGFSRNGRILDVNPKYVEIYGLNSADDVIGTPVAERWSPESRPMIEEIRRRYRTEPGATPGTYEGMALRLDGSRFPAQVQKTSNLELPDGPAGFAFIADITESKRAEEALRASEARFRSLVEHAPCAICISRESVILYMNRRCVQLFAEDTAEHLIGTSILDLFAPETRQQIEQIGLQYRQGAIDSADGEGFAVRGGSLHFPVHFEATAVQLPDGPAIITFLTDLTARKAAERLIREAERQYRDIFAEAPEGIFRVSATGELLAVNPAGARMLGYASPDVAKQTSTNVERFWMDPSRRSIYIGLLSEQGEVRDFECELRRKDGTGLWASLNARRVCAPDGRTRHYQGYYTDLTEKKRLEKALRDRIREIQLLSEMNNALLRATNEEDLLKQYCRIVVETGGYHMAWVGFADANPEKRIIPVAHFGREDGYLQAANLTWDESEHGQGPTGRAIKSGLIQIVEQFSTDPRTLPWREQAARRGYQSGIAIPFRHSEGGMACLTAYGSAHNAFSESELKLMEQIASALGFGITTLRTAIAKDRYRQDLYASLEQTIEVISLAVDQRDPYTAGHQKRVADLCVRIAERLDLNPDRIQGLRLAATIHDLGKIGIPAEILAKPGKLTPIQYEMIKEHAQLGYEIVRNVRFPWHIGDIIRQHHERLDGSGYPLCMRGEDILLEARILAVADVVEAMGSHRPYRAARGLDVALNEILTGRGSLYDADAVNACVSLFQQDNYTFPA